MKKVVTCLALLLTLLLVLAGCKSQTTKPTSSQMPTQEAEVPEPSSQLKAPAESPKAESTFDIALAGRWSQVLKETVQNGDVSFDMPLHISLLPDGTYFNSINDEVPYTYSMEQGSEPVRATTESGMLHLVDAVYQWNLDAGLASQE